jgi:serine/threonine-protein kinase
MTRPPDTVGRYHVERLIAHGGMGSLYLARDPVIDRLVVIKFLKDGFDDPATRERFAREARAAGRLHHPNIVTVFDVGEHDSRPFIAMEYVSGETLAQLIARRAVSRVWEKLAILEDLCAGLHFAHCAAIVHRDIKPANVMRDESGVVKILDFGIARAGGAVITRAGDVVGTLNYMSPEQLAGQQVDHRADIYSVGTLAYELITDQMAFPGSVQTGVLSRILNSGPVPIASLVPGVDPDLAASIERAMAREPDARYRDLDTMRQDLAAVRARLLDTAADLEEATDPNAETRFDSGRVVPRPQRRSSSGASSTLSRQARAVAGRGSDPGIRRPRRLRPMMVLGIAGATVAVGLAATLMLDRASPPVPSDAVAPQQAQPSSPSPAPPAATAVQPEGDRTRHEEQVSAARATARQQIGLGQRQRALETLIRGLALDEKDPELNRLVDELIVAARGSASEARAAAAIRGATANSSAPFREGQARERDADRLLLAGDRMPGIRASWAAAALYVKAAEAMRQTASAAPLPPAQPEPAPVEPPSPKPGSQPVPTFPSSELKTLPAPVDKPSAPPPPPPAPKDELPSVPRDAAVDPGAADLSAIRETLRRYTQAYQSLDGAAVGRMMPSLTAEQRRDLDRDLSNYRSYTVDIRDQSIRVDGQTAAVTCQVVRSFETKTGVKGRDARQTIFHLRRSGSAWTVERLESR